MQVIQRIALAIVIIGAFNWGVTGLFRFDVVEPLARRLYILIGVAGLFSTGILFSHWQERRGVEVHFEELKKASPKQKGNALAYSYKHELYLNYI